MARIEEIEEAASFQIIGGLAFIEFAASGETRQFTMPVPRFRESIRRANRAMDAWAEQHPGDVVSLSGRKRRR